MRRSSLYGHVAELLGLVLDSPRPADGIVRDFYRSRHYLGARDRRFISDVLFGILRHFLLLDHLLKRALAESRPLAVPGQIPPIAYVIAHALKVQGETAESLLPEVSGLWRTATADIDPALFLNTLAGVPVPPPELKDPVQRSALEQSLPPGIVREWFERFGEQEGAELCRALNGEPPTTLRVNSLKCSVEECAAALRVEGVSFRRTALSPLGLQLERRVNIQSLRAYREGFCELQDEGSQLIGFLVGARPGNVVVDACAGAGGKTLHIAAEMRNSGSILALDTEERRLRNLYPRLRRNGVTIVRGALAASAGPILAELQGKADAVLIDAPCSGVGTFRRNPGAKRTFSEEGAKHLQGLQSRLLQDYSALVKPGGRLVYSTCTLLRGENEDRLAAFLAAHPEFSTLPASGVLRNAGIPIDEPGENLLLLPHRSGTDGFFASVMVRRP